MAGALALTVRTSATAAAHGGALGARLRSATDRGAAGDARMVLKHAARINSRDDESRAVFLPATRESRGPDAHARRRQAV
ncbi:hypothetical protein LGM90_08650 [Burkholderia sp. AU28942]|uniref:hypothetical protein n=1 Tax=Burkholderia latens TaxID=488446 RepID=UPI00084135E0|nr:hypothetical protein [Burkholderia latens]MBR7959461.1 hypothetical protein [Burkholderia vietnamiensis]MCA8308572.1 hypothetical protein [Burkholderia sp. AU28942]AOK08474.1 hypothetical protein WK25_29310 [Burkholderia latens]MBR8145635.1 hypothetical protein [Burkholderia vietnamiensis]QTO49949.1 hypothetical protein J8I86_20525 [Burkholderia latens]